MSPGLLLSTALLAVAVLLTLAALRPGGRTGLETEWDDPLPRHAP